MHGRGLWVCVRESDLKEGVCLWEIEIPCVCVYTDGNTAPEEVRRLSVCASRLPALRQGREELRIRFQTEAAAEAWSPNTTHSPRFKSQTHTRTGTRAEEQRPSTGG